MNRFSKLFKKKSSETSEANSQWLEGYNSFEKGKEFFLNRQMLEALHYFDLAVTNGYENNVYGFRATCLAQLGYDYDAIEDLNKEISSSPNDCNNYFLRSLSKSAILDYEGAIADMEKAIELSKGDNNLNKAYNDDAKKLGYSNGAIEMFQQYLISSKMDLAFEMENRERIKNATSPKWKAELQKMNDERREKKLNRIKRR